MANGSPLKKHAASVMARATVLEDIIQGKRDGSLALIQACASAVKLAALDAPELGITVLGSRNTLFKYANILLADRLGKNGERGWPYLDSLRRDVYQNGSSQKQCTSREEKTSQLSTLKRHLNETQIMMLAQSNAYVSLLTRVAAIARSSEIDALVSKRLLNLLNDHDETFGGLFAPNVIQQARPKNVRGIDGSS